MTTALTDFQYYEIRQDTGDVNNNPYDVDDATLTDIYNDPLEGNLSLTLTKVYVLRRRRGIAVNSVDDTGNIIGINSHSSQKLAQILQLLAYWESVAGMSMGQSVGTDSSRMTRKDNSRLNRVFGWQADASVERYITGYSTDDDD